MNFQDLFFNFEKKLIGLSSKENIFSANNTPIYPNILQNFPWSVHIHKKKAKLMFESYILFYVGIFV